MSPLPRFSRALPVPPYRTPDDRHGETADEAAIRSFCEGKIAHYKIPRYIRFVDSFPTTVTGKVQKFVLRAETAAELGLAEERTA
jgi:fatty-acyl-CoA synthase